MNNLIKYSLLMMFVLALFVPGVYGITVGALSGDATGAVGSTTTYKAPTASSINDAITLGSGSKLTQSIDGNGSLDQQHSASNKYLATAVVRASWSNSSSYTYTYSIYPGEGTGFSSGYVKADEALSVEAAENLSVSAEASNAEGDYAMSWAYADCGTLGSYTNTARADRFSASSSQAAGYASYVASNSTGVIPQQSSSAIDSKAAFASSTVPGSSQGTGFFSTAKSTRGGYAHSWMKVNDSSGLDANHIFGGYKDSSKATKSSATISQSTKSASGQWVQYGGEASNAEGDRSYLANGFWAGSISGYSGTESAVSSSAISTQSLVSAASLGAGYYGHQNDMVIYSKNTEGDVANSSIQVIGGVINSMKGSATSKKLTLSNSQSFASASGAEIYAFTDASNKEGDYTDASTSVANGYTDTYTASSAASKSMASVSAKFKSSQGSAAEFQSTAVNRAKAMERLKTGPAFRGYANFLVRTDSKSPLVASTTTKATAKDITITPTSSATKTALILDPYHLQAISIDSVDSSACIARNLSTNGYSVLTFEDSAATSARYATLSKYNIGLAVGHMSTSLIGLSTYPVESVITASQLASSYKNPPENSFVILAGCESFEGYKTPTPLARAVSKASLRGGFDNTVYILWTHAYLAELYYQMAQGKTAGDANDYVWNIYRYKWTDENPDFDPDDPYVARLVFYGDESFKL